MPLKTSMQRMLMKWACGWSVRLRVRSSTTERTPSLASSSAVVRPVGPPPAITTGAPCIDAEPALPAASPNEAVVETWRQPQTADAREAGVPGGTRAAAPRQRHSRAAVQRAASAVLLAMLVDEPMAGRSNFQLAQQLPQLVFLLTGSIAAGDANQRMMTAKHTSLRWPEDERAAFYHVQNEAPQEQQG